MMPVTTEIRRGNARFTTREPGRLTRHALSFGPHYDPERLRIGTMVCHDEHVLGAGRGFTTHAHADLEIVTWVLAGGLDHRDSLGTEQRLGPGSVAVLSAGSGVEHSETAAPGEACRFVQAWLVPDEAGRTPRYSAARVEPAALAGGLLTVASGSDAAARVPVGSAGADLAVARLEAGEQLRLPPVRQDAVVRHLYVSTGALLRFSLAEPLAAGDAFTSVGPLEDPEVAVVAAVPTELMVWTFV